MTKIELIHGDCLDKLKELPDNSVDSIVTDPPYGLLFMGKKWDYDVPSEEIWRECLRVLKPGGHLLAFAGTRTQHRMAVRIEDAGFEIRDMIAWVYGSGFPKSLNIGKAVDKLQGNEREVIGQKDINTIKALQKFKEQDGRTIKEDFSNIDTRITKGTSPWEGWGTALKPALEPITVARKPLIGTVAENVLTHGTGGINIDESRVISYTTAYNDGDNNDCTLQEHIVLEIRHKICSEPPFSLSESLELSRLSSDDEYGQKWYKQRDYSDDCSSCRRLYDALLPLFLKGDQVSVQQLHDVLADIDRLRTEQKHNPSSQDSDLPSSLDDFYQLILSYLNDTTLILNRQEKITLNLNKKGEQLFNEGDVKKAKWSGESEERTGRFPANLIHDGSEEVVGLFPNSSGGAFPKKHGSSGFVSPEERESRIEMKDQGSAARFFYCAKASKKDRDEGLEGHELHQPTHGKGHEKGGLQVSNSKNPRANNHPTVKPTELMRYLCRLVTPKGGTVLDPFMGSGSTGKAAKLEGFDFIGIEREAEYIQIAEARINAVDNKLF